MLTCPAKLALAFTGFVTVSMGTRASTFADWLFTRGSGESLRTMTGTVVVGGRGGVGGVGGVEERKACHLVALFEFFHGFFA